MGGTLIEFPLEPSDIQLGNITISNYNAIHTSKVDKNNNGALAFWYGSEMDGFTFYPGDANYEAIRIPAIVKGNIIIMIATHHGSLHSISPAGAAVGSTIPRAAKKARTSTYVYTGKGNHNIEEEVDNPIAVFSYGQNNSYNHNVKVAGPAYQSKGYNTLLATENLGNGGASGGVCYFLANLLTNANVNKVQAQLSSCDPKSKFSITQNKTTATSSIQGDTGIAQGNADNRQFPHELTLDHDLSNYAVMPSHTLISFSIEPGPDWEGPAEAGKEGRAGKRAFTGDCLDLRVSRNWMLTNQTGQPLFSSEQSTSSSGCSVAIEYVNGKGGQGQQGGRGTKGMNGIDGLGETSGDVKGKRAESGMMGGKGARGCAGGEPAWFPASRVLATKEKIELPIAKLSSIIKADTFGMPGKGGLGGQGGPGGLGGMDGLRYNTDRQVDHQNSNRRQASGPKGTTGLEGKSWEGQCIKNDPALDCRNGILETQRLLLTPQYWLVGKQT